MKTKLKVCVGVELLDYDCIWDTSQQVQGKQRELIIIIEETKEECLHPYVKEAFFFILFLFIYFEDLQHRWGPWGEYVFWGQPISHFWCPIGHQDVLFGSKQSLSCDCLQYHSLHCNDPLHSQDLRLHVTKMASFRSWNLLWISD